MVCMYMSVHSDVIMWMCVLDVGIIPFAGLLGGHTHVHYLCVHVVSWGVGCMWNVYETLVGHASMARHG